MNKKIVNEGCDVNAIKCSDCGDLIFSRARHDFHYCTCGNTAVDGGFEYTKVSHKGVMPMISKLHIDVTKQELMDDWNSGKDKFGVIKQLTPKQKTDKVSIVKGKKVKTSKT